jgi:hypothetical protein
LAGPSAHFSRCRWQDVARRIFLFQTISHAARRVDVSNNFVAGELNRKSTVRGENLVGDPSVAEKWRGEKSSRKIKKGARPTCPGHGFGRRENFSQWRRI